MIDADFDKLLADEDEEEEELPAWLKGEEEPTEAPAMAAAPAAAEVEEDEPLPSWLDGDDEERHGHERLGDDDPGRAERERDVEPAVQELTDDPPPAGTR